MELAIIDGKELQALRVYAEQHVVPLEELYLMMAKKLPPIGDAPEYRREFDDGYRIVFSIEQQPNSYVRHLSVSLANGNAPSVNIVRFIMKMLGYENQLEKCITWMENYGGSKSAINIVEEIKDEQQKGNLLLKTQG
jgi:hypothetical protein